MARSWGAKLGGIYIPGGPSDTPVDCEEDPVEIFPGCLTDTPDGLSIPGQDTEDVSYAQRDGVKHFSDWYVPRFITLKGAIGPSDCPPGCTVRSSLFSLGQAWKRGCCDTELVIYPPCDVPHSEDNAYPPNPELAVLQRTNLATSPRGERFITGLNELGANDNIANGTYSLETTDGPTEELSYFARKTSTSASTAGSTFGLTEDDPNVAPVTALNDVPVTAGSTYTLSLWMRSSVAATNFHASVRWYDNAGAAVAAIDTVQVATSVAANTWTRVTRTIVAPVGATRAAFRVRTDGAVNGMTTDVAGILFEQSATMGTYFDGSMDNLYDDTLEGWYTFEYTGVAEESTSTESLQGATYSGTIESGPYGIIGRPRVFDFKWRRSKKQIADILMRFDSVDQRMYILDECGTPGTNSCAEIVPGSLLFSRCYTNGTGAYAGQKVRCYSGSGRCYPNLVTSDDSVAPVTLGIGGTEKVFPTITLFPNLSNPVIENMTTGDWIGYEGDIDGSTVITIDTEEGTAFDEQGNSHTHLLRGSLFMSLEPGNYELRLLSSGVTDEDTGYSLVCWRDTVVMA